MTNQERLEHFVIRAENSCWIHSKIVETLELYRCFDSDQLLYHLPILALMHRQLISESVWLNRLDRKVTFTHSPTRAFKSVALDIHPIANFRKAADAYLKDALINMSAHSLDELISYENLNGYIQSYQLAKILMNYFNYQSYIRSKVIEKLEDLGLMLDFDDLLYPFSKNLEIID